MNQESVSPALAEPPTPPFFDSFAELGASEDVQRALLEMGFMRPMPVQAAVFQKMMAGCDLLVQSKTGSGKTAAFGIPIAQGLVDPASPKVQALILAPTRELALQSASECEKIAKYRKLHVVPLYGGAPMGKQLEQLKGTVHVVSGTPGRILDHLDRGTLKLNALKLLVFDEADEMLSMGFLEDIMKILSYCPKVADRQTVLFSATFPEDVERISRRQMKDPEKIQLSASTVAASEIKHYFYMVSGMGRAKNLVTILDAEKPESAIIFCNTRDDTAQVAEYLRKVGRDAEAISSDLSQSDRERVMQRMKDKNLKYLVATDIAARGIDISDLSHVINYTFPESAEVYVHRTGRTGRAGKAGTALSLISPRELASFYMLKLTYKIKPEERELPGFDPNAQPAPLSPMAHRAAQAAAKSAPTLVAQPEETAQPIASSRPAPMTRLDAPARPAATAPAPTTNFKPTTMDAKPMNTNSTADTATPTPPTPRPTGTLFERFSQRMQAMTPSKASEELAQSILAMDAEAQRILLAQLVEAEHRARTGRGEAKPARPERGPRPERAARPERAPRAAQTEGGAHGKVPAAARPTPPVIDKPDDREFWEAWADDSAAITKIETAPALENGAVNAADESAGDEPTTRPPLPEGKVRLFVNVGRRNRVRRPDLEQLLTEKDLKADRVDVRLTHTFLIVDSDNADQICTALTGAELNQRPISCERAKHQ